MVLTRQGVPVLAETAAKAKDGVKKGAYVPGRHRGHSGRHPHGFRFRGPVGLAAAKTLAGEGVKARVVSVPSMEWSRGSRTPSTRRLAPGRCQGSCLRRGALPCRGTSTSAPTASPSPSSSLGLRGDGAQNMIDLGITAEHVVEAAKASIAEVEAASQS